MKIHIKDLKAQTVLGIYDWEKQAPREIIINLTLEIDAPRAAASDDIADTLDYDAVENCILDYVQAADSNLIETLAAGILERLSQFPLVRKAAIEIDKPGALKHAVSVSVSAERSY